jgi:hypothetical protein
VIHCLFGNYYIDLSKVMAAGKDPDYAIPKFDIWLSGSHAVLSFLEHDAGGPEEFTRGCEAMIAAWQDLSQRQ